MNKNLLQKRNKSFFLALLLAYIVIPICASGSESLLPQPDKKVTLKLTNVPIKTILMEMQKQTKINFVYTVPQLDSLGKKSINVKDMVVTEALALVLARTGYNYRVNGNTVAIVKRGTPLKPGEVAGVGAPKPASMSRISLTGKIIDPGKNPIVGATILVGSTTNGAITNDKGQFTISVRVGNVLKISYVGMDPISYTVKPGDKDIVIKMSESSMAVEDVVVTGYFNRNKATYTGNAATYTGKELTEISSSNIMVSLSMLDPSFNMIVDNEFGSDPNKIPDFEIQGPTNLKDEYSESPNMPTFILDGFQVSAQKVFDLDPNTVKTVTLLKDAAASAIYGSLAANGVVVIETYPPIIGKLKLDYRFYGDFEFADVSSYNLMNSWEKLNYEVEAKVFSAPVPFLQVPLEEQYNNKYKLVRKGYDTDWIKKPINDIGFSHKHTISVQGGNNQLRYTMNMNYRGQAGIMKESGRDNYGLGLKLQYNSKKVKIMNDLSVSSTKAYNSPYGSFNSYTLMNPYLHPYDEKGNIVREIGDEKNPLFNSTLKTKDQSVLLDISERISIDMDLFSNFSLRVQGSLDREITRSDVFKPRSHTDFIDKVEQGSYKSGLRTRNAYNINVVAQYKFVLKKNQLNIGVVGNITEALTDSYDFVVYNFPNDNFDHISMGTTYGEGKTNGSENITRNMGFTMNANYSYDRKYLLDMSLRSDASSIYGSNKRWGTFYSVGLGWNLHNEKFMKKIKPINTLKIRISKGTTGSQGFSPYQAMMTYTYKDNDIKDIPYQGQLGALLLGYGNKNLQWQVTDKLNLGMDFSLLNNRFSGYLNRYINVTRSKLISFTLAPSTGFPTYMENIGNVDNSGWELNLRGILLRNIKKNYSWNITLNVRRNINELKNVGDALTEFNKEQAAKENGGKPITKYIEGQSLSTIWGNYSLGIDPASGNEVFRDLEGNKIHKHSAANDVNIGDTVADFYGNISTSFNYKGFSMSLSFKYSVGADVYNQTLVSKIENANPLKNADKRVLYDRWKRAGDVSQFKRISDKSTTLRTSRFVEEDNFLQLQSLNISYRLKNKKLAKNGIQQLQFGLISNDLFRLSPVRMERGTSYPFARKVSVNVQVSF